MLFQVYIHTQGDQPQGYNGQILRLVRRNLTFLCRSIRFAGFFLFFVLFSGCNLGFIEFETSLPQIKNPPKGLNNGPPPAKLLVDGQNLIELGICSPLKVSTKSENNEAAPVGEDIEIKLALSGLGEARFYNSEVDCKNGIESRELVLKTGSDSREFWVKAYQNLHFSIVAVSDGLETFTRMVTVQRNPQKIVLTSSVDNVDGGYCSGKLQVQMLDAFGRPFNDSRLNLILSGAERGDFYVDSGCTQASSNKRQVHTGSTVDFYFKDMFFTDGEIKIKVEVESYANIPVISQSVQVNQAVYQLKIENGPSTNLDLGLCSEVVVKTLDSENNEFDSGTPVTINMRMAAGGGRYFPTLSECQNDNYKEKSSKDLLVSVRREGRLYFRPTSSPSLTLKAESGVLVPSLVNRTINRRAQNLAFIQRPSEIKGGRCSDRFTVQIQDGVGDPFTGSNIKLKLLTGANGRFFASALANNRHCNTDDNANIGDRVVSGSTADFYFQSHKIEDATIRVEAENQGHIANLEQGYSVKREVDNFILTNFSSPPANLYLGECSGPYQIRTRDSENQIYANDLTGGINAGLSILEGLVDLYPTLSECQSGTNKFSSSINIPNSSSSKDIFLKPLMNSGPSAIRNFNVGFRISQTQLLIEPDEKSLTTIRDPRGLFVTSEPAEKGGGYCGRFEVEARDRLNNAFLNSGLTVNLVRTGSGANYGTLPDCDSKTNAIFQKTFPITGSVSKIDYYFRSDSIESDVTLTMSANPNPPPPQDVTPAQTTFNVISVPYKLRIAGGLSGNLNIGVCSAIPPSNLYKVEVLNVQDSLYSGPKVSNITVGNTTGTARYFSDQGVCQGDTGTNQQDLSSTTGPAGINRDVSFYLRAVSQTDLTMRAAGTFSYNGNTVSLIAATLGSKTVDRIPIQITLSGSGAIDSTTCSPAYTVVMRDGMGFYTAHGNLSVELSAQTNAKYYSDTRCLNELPPKPGVNPPPSLLTIPTGVSDAQFYIRDDQAEGINFTATYAAVPLVSSAKGVTVLRNALGLDRVFTGAGEMEFSVDSSTAAESAQAIARLTDGGIVMVGGSDNRVALAKINEYGDFNSSFDGDGKMIHSAIGGNSRGEAIVAYGDGGFFVAGESSNQFFLARYSQNGVPDSLFGTIGVVKLSFMDPTVSPSDPPILLPGAKGKALGVLSGGDIIVAGTVTYSNGSTKFALARYSSSGTLIYQKVITDLSNSYNDLNGMAIGSFSGSERIVLVGETWINANYDFMVAMVSPADGSLDTSFDGDGYSISNFNASSLVQDRAQAVLIDNEQIVVVGLTGTSLDLDMGIAVFNAGGTRLRTKTIHKGSRDGAFAVMKDKDGNYIVSGQSSNSNNSNYMFYVTRLAPSDLNLIKDSEIDFSNISFIDSIYGSTPLPDGKMIVVGQTRGKYFGAAKLLH